MLNIYNYENCYYFIIQMFGRFARILQKAMPLSAFVATCLLPQAVPQMIDGEEAEMSYMVSTGHLFRKNQQRIKYVRDLNDYVEKLLVKSRAIVLFELTGDKLIDDQVLELAQQFIKKHESDISMDFQFIFLEPVPALAEKDVEHYFIIYSVNGEKVINIDSYLKKSPEKAHLKLNTKPLMKRLIESLNVYKEVGLENIHKELRSMDVDNNYVALYTAAEENYKTENAIKVLKRFQKEYSTKSKNVQKFVVKDDQTRRLLGLKSNDQSKVYLLVGDSPNLRKQFKENASFFSINGKKYANINISESNLNDIFIFPPVQRILNPTDFVINVYVNRNRTHELIPKIYQELSKPEYASYPKGLYFSNDVEEAAIFYELNDYSTASLQAYQKNTKMDPKLIKQTLTRTFQYEFPLSSSQPTKLEQLYQWLQDCQENKIPEYFQSQKLEETYAQQIVGEQYKQIRDQPRDKVIYHYSTHCHGCKKFGGKYQEFAKNSPLNHPHIDFYRINNDNNKAEGVRNYNSTPVFVFYKNNHANPFIYKMPFFTEKLFDSFLKITSAVQLMPIQQFQTHVKERTTADVGIRELIDELKL